MECNADFTVRNEGSIFLITPMSEDSKTALAERVDPEATWFGPSLVVEHRYIGDIVEGMSGEGFTFSQEC